MSARSEILQAIRTHKPPSPPLPSVPGMQAAGPGIQGRFCESLLLAGAEWTMESQIEDWNHYLRTHYPDSKSVVTTLPDLAGPTIQLLPAKTAARSLRDVDVTIVRGDLGVAENGAIWVPEERLVTRVLPFITQHLILLLPTNRIVETMHDAYHNIQLKKCSFGVFIAGPSKTADIEQSLVKGAQGARSELVVLQAAAD